MVTGSQAQTIAHYKLLGSLGAGGMGEVYLAEDQRLGRKVALKILPEEVASDPDRLQRFEREARTASSLNHPNILTIYDIGSDGDTHYIATEYVEGETLRKRLQTGSPDLKEALAVAVQLAGALAAAHSAGVLHRDVKPENIMMRPDGFVKLLDFGLAKIILKPPRVDASNVPTIDRSTPGQLLGTLPYMSPEQVRGNDVDARTDVFSMGAVLYEMVTGRKAFGADTPAEILLSVLTHETPAIPERNPAHVLNPILAKALHKERDRRYQSANELLTDLQEAQARLADQPAKSRKFAPWLSFLRRNKQPEPQPRTAPRLTQVTFGEGIEESPAWSPDGRRLTFSREISGIRKIFVKDVQTGQETQITKGDRDELQPAWFPSREALLFVRGRDPGDKLQPADVFGMHSCGDVWLADLSAGQEYKLIENGHNPQVSPDGKQIAVDASWAGPRRIWVTDARGLNPQQVTTDHSEEVRHIRPRWSSDGRLVFMNTERTNFNIRTVELAGRTMRWVTNDQFQDLHPAWSPSGDFIYFSSNRGGGTNLWRRRIALDGSPEGAPEQVTTGAGVDVEVALSPGGKRLAFSVLRQNAGIWRLPVDPQTGRAAGTPEGVITSNREESRAAASPDNTLIAFNSDRTGETTLWVHNTQDRSLHQLTRTPGGDYQPNWSPDRKSLAFFSSRSGKIEIWTVDIASGKLKQLTRGESVNANPFYSPDGRLIAYMSDASGRMEVWVMNSDGSHQRQLSRTGVMGHFLRWAAAGKGIVFRCYNNGAPQTLEISLDGGDPKSVGEVAGGAHMSFSPDFSRIMDVVGHKVLYVSTLQSGKPEKVFEFAEPDVRIDYPVWSPDGRWILFDRYRVQGSEIWMMEIAE